MSATKKQTYQKGMWAENLAELFLKIKGYRIIERRYKTPVGEIDILAMKHAALIAVEVKARDSHDDAAYAVTPKTQNRIARAMDFYLSQHSYHVGRDIRFDVITIKSPFFIRHIDNAWRPRS